MLNKIKDFYIQWHITEKCNLRCSHCYQENYSSNDLEWNELKQIAETIVLTLKRWNRVGRIALTGGEPFFSKHLYGLLQFFNESECISCLTVLSNGTMITEEDINWLKTIDKLREVQISLDGAIPETHNKIRGENVFEQVIKNIRLLRENNIGITLMFTLHRGNAKEVPQLIDLAIRESVNGITVERITPCGSGKDLKDFVLSPLELKDVYSYINQRAEDNDVKKSDLVIRRRRPLWAISNNRNMCESCSTKTIGGFCPIGFTSLAILHDGTVLPCRRLNIPIGNILKDGLFKIWYTSDVLWRIRDKNNLKGKCKGCKYISSCGGCRAVAYAMTGDYMEEDPQCWK